MVWVKLLSSTARCTEYTASIVIGGERELWYVCVCVCVCVWWWGVCM